MATRIERIQQHLNQYLALTTPTILSAVWDVDKPNVKQAVNAVMRDEAVVNVTVATDAEPNWVQSTRNTEGGDKLFSRTIPLMKEKQPIGTYSITLSDHLIKGELLSNISQQAIILLMQNLISLGFILWLLHVRLLRPLLQLKADTDRLALSGLDTPIVALHADEIGAVALGLDKARHDLKSSFEQFEALNATLENRVSDRTIELKTANEELRSTITQLDQARDDLVETDKLSSLGALVAGVAHELNTPIGNALLLSSTLVDESESFAPRLKNGMTRTDLLKHEELIRHSSELIQNNCARAAELITSFKQVAVDRTSAMRRKGQLRQFIHEILSALNP